METATTEQLHERYVFGGLFRPGEINGYYTHEDRMLVAGAVPGAEGLHVDAPDVVAEASLLTRRELGIVNVGIGGPAATVEVASADGERERFELGELDSLYVGRGHDITLHGEGARLYLVSALAHADTTAARIGRADVEPVELGSDAEANRRTLYRYVWGGGHASCQLQFGVTVVAEGSVWNTMPPHVHERRTEVYLYTGLGESGRVLHLMGKPGATRHVFVSDGEAVLAPNWSVHAGAGTQAYAFVWAMAGENNDYGDLCPICLEAL